MGFGAFGCGCNCGVTVYRVNPSTGEIIWSKSRGAGGSLVVADQALAVDGFSIYTFGTEVTGKDDGVLMKWADDGTDASLVWHSDRSGGTALVVPGAEDPAPNRDHIAVSPDGTVVWALGANGIFSYHASTGARRGAYTGPAPVPTGTWSDAGAGSAMVVDPSSNHVYVSTGSGKIYKFDSNCAVVASAFASAAVEDMCIVGSELAVSGNSSDIGSFTIDLFDLSLVRLDRWLASTHTSPAPSSTPLFELPGRNDLYTAFRFGGNVYPWADQPRIGYFNAVSFGSGFVVRSEMRIKFGLDYPSTVFNHPTRGPIPSGTEVNAVWIALMNAGGSITESWWDKLDGETQGDYGMPMAGDGSHIYVANGDQFEKRDSGGNLIWSVSDSVSAAGLFPWNDIRLGSAFILVTGNIQEGTASCIEKGDGSLRWQTDHQFGDLSSVVTSDDRIYVVGNKGGVSEV